MTAPSFPLLRSALFGGGGRFLTLVVGLFMTPYLLLRLGPEGFGVWALAAVVNGLVGFLDFGFKTSFVKHLAETHAGDDRDGHDAVLTTAVAFYALFAAAAMGLFLALRGPLLDLFRITGELRPEAAAVFTLTVAGFLLAGLFGPFAAVCEARHRLDVTNSLGVGALVVATALTVALVEAGWGLRGVALAQLGGIVLFSLSTVIAARVLAGRLRLSLRLLGGGWFRRLFRFGLQLHVSLACETVNRQLDKLLLSRWAGLPFVASYEIGLRVAANAGTFQPFLAAGLLPASSHLTALGARDELLRVYRRASRYLFLVGVPPFVFLAAHADTVVLAWIGRPDPVAATVLLLLAGGYLVNSLTNAMAAVCQGIGRPDLQARQSALQLTANVVLSVGLFVLLGPFGAPLGTSLALLLGAAYFGWRFHPVLGTSTGEVLRAVAPVPVGASLLAAVAALAAAWGFAPEDRLEAVLELLLAGGVFAAVYLLIGRLAGLIGRRELRDLAAALRHRPQPEGP